jgi:hypothetical protein
MPSHRVQVRFYNIGQRRIRFRRGGCAVQYCGNHGFRCRGPPVQYNRHCLGPCSSRPGRRRRQPFPVATVDRDTPTHYHRGRYVCATSQSGRPRASNGPNLHGQKAAAGTTVRMINALLLVLAHDDDGNIDNNQPKQTERRSGGTETSAGCCDEVSHLGDPTQSRLQEQHC